MTQGSAHTSTGDRRRRSAGLGWFGAGALRAENERLNALLVRSEEAAARFAILLREGDHRIKNSLQIVASLMQMQARAQESPVVAEALRSAAARVQSIARIHDALQAQGGHDLVDLGATIETMCRDLHAMSGDPRGVAISVTIEPILAPVALAQPIVLAINELVVNALRHAFPHDRTGAIRVSVYRAKGGLRIVVADDGVGLPAGHGANRGYGMSLVRTVVGQIKGTLTMESDTGLRVTLVAPLPRSA